MSSATGKPTNRDALLLMQQRFPQYFQKSKAESKKVERSSSATGPLPASIHGAEPGVAPASAAGPSPPTATAAQENPNANSVSTESLPAPQRLSLLSPRPPTTPPQSSCPPAQRAHAIVVSPTAKNETTASGESFEAPVNTSAHLEPILADSTTASRDSLPALRDEPRLSVDDGAFPVTDSGPFCNNTTPPPPHQHQGPPPAPFTRATPSPGPFCPTPDTNRTTHPPAGVPPDPDEDDDDDDDDDDDKPFAPSASGLRKIPMTPNTSALLQAMRRKTPFNLGGNKDLMKALQARTSRTQSSSSSSSDEDLAPVNNAEPYIASVGAMKVKHRQRSSAVTFNDQFPQRHDPNAARTPITNDAPSNFSARQSSPVFLPRVRMGKQRIYRF